VLIAISETSGIEKGISIIMQKARWARCFVALIALLTPAFAQITGELVVRVSDPASASIAGAQVNITSISNNSTRTANTNSLGSVRFSLLDAGQYKVQVTQQGFATTTTTATVNVSSIRELEIKLELSTTRQEVVVEESAVLINTTTAMTTNGIEAKQLTQLALPNGVLSLAGTTPGVIPVAARNPFLGQGSYNANGGRGRSNNITIDGAQATDVSTTGGAGTGTVPLDAIKEIAIISNQFSAEYGRNSNSQYQIVTKGGTNDLHMRLVHFLNNNALNARDYFDRTGRAATVRDNRWNINAGGSIIKNRLFYFGTYEQQKIRGTGGTRIANVLTTAQVAGITSAAARQLFTDAQGLSDPSGTVSNSAPLGSNSIAYSGRIDYVISDRQVLYGRYAYQDQESRSPGLTFISSNVPTNGASSTGRPQSVALNYTLTLNPTTVINQQATFLRSNPNFTPLASITAPSVLFQDGTSEIGSWSGLPQGRTQNVYNTLTTVTKIFNNHSFKAGYGMERIQANSVFDSNVRGSLTFVNIAAFQAGTPVTYSQRFGGSIRGNRVRNHSAFFQDDWRVNRKLTLNLGLRAEIAGGVTEVNNIISNLNLNSREALGGAGTGPLGAIVSGGSVFNTNYNWAPRFGFAYSPADKWSIRGGYSWAYDFIFLNPITNLRFAPPFMYNFSTTDFTGSNTLGNILSGTSQFQQTGRAAVGNFGTTIRNFGGFNPVDYAMDNPRVQTWTMSIERQLGSDFVGRVAYTGTKGDFLTRARPINTIRPELLRPATSVEDENARRAEFLALNAGLNAPPTGQTNRLDGRFTGVSINESSANSIYHGFTGYLARSFRNRLGFTASYTWSKSIDDNSDVLNVLATDTPAQQNPFNNRDNRARSAFDVGHRFVVTHSYVLPVLASSNGFMKNVFGGWNVSGIYQMQGGFPVNLFGGARLGLPDPLLLGGGGQVRPNLVGPLNITFEPNPGTVTAAMSKITNSGLAQPLVGNFGTLGRNAIRQNGLVQYDMTLQKEFKLREKYTFQIQSQFNNLFNNTSFARPGQSLAAPAVFGWYSDTDTNSRTVFLVGRFYF
jgi:hypothetical protein